MCTLNLQTNLIIITVYMLVSLTGNQYLYFDIVIMNVNLFPVNSNKSQSFRQVLSLLNYFPIRYSWLEWRWHHPTIVLGLRAISWKWISLFPLFDPIPNKQQYLKRWEGMIKANCARMYITDTHTHTCAHICICTHTHTHYFYTFPMLEV